MTSRLETYFGGGTSEEKRTFAILRVLWGQTAGPVSAGQGKNGAQPCLRNALINVNGEKRRVPMG